MERTIPRRPQRIHGGHGGKWDFLLLSITLCAPRRPSVSSLEKIPYSLRELPALCGSSILRRTIPRRPQRIHGGHGGKTDFLLLSIPLCAPQRSSVYSAEKGPCLLRETPCPPWFVHPGENVPRRTQRIHGGHGGETEIFINVHSPLCTSAVLSVLCGKSSLYPPWNSVPSVVRQFVSHSAQAFWRLKNRSFLYDLQDLPYVMAYYVSMSMDKGWLCRE